MSNNTLNFKSPRIEVIDALRGFAVMSIMLLHNIEHFDYYYLPENLTEWVKILDKIIAKRLSNESPIADVLKEIISQNKLQPGIDAVSVRDAWD